MNQHQDWNPVKFTSAMQSNNIVPVGNPNAQTAQGNIGPNMTGDIPLRGGRRRRSRGRGKRGGNWGYVASQAIVPGALIMMNNALGKRSRSRK